MTFELEVIDAPTAYDVPVPFARVFHPAKLYPAKSRLPVFDATVAVPASPVWVAGAAPLEAPFASYEIW
jgi:hypothetical protein